jgi:hypothetical protein
MATQKKKTGIPKRITIKWLRRHNACAGGRAVFRRLFGKSAAFTPSNVRKMLAVAPHYYHDGMLISGRHLISWLLFKGDRDRFIAAEDRYAADRICLRQEWMNYIGDVVLRLSRKNLKKKGRSAQ